ncbi:hypothetical protein [Bacillus marinisedimentorum]|nr:hypothetical protein [Bacillus marinisedimentorum]
MEGKPIHYDGSVQNPQNPNGESVNETFKLTEEMRVNISANPYIPADPE